MGNLLVTCSEMNPSLIPLWIQTWDDLKKHHPNLKVTVFCYPVYRGLVENDVFRNKEFLQWYRERRGWVEIGQLGYGLKNKSDCKRFSSKQYSLLHNGYRKIGSFMSKEIYSFRAPQYRMNEYTLPILVSLGFSACMYHGKFIILCPVDAALTDHSVVESSISMDERNPDNIVNIKEKMDQHLSKMEKRGYRYLTTTELIKKSILVQKNEI